MLKITIAGSRPTHESKKNKNKGRTKTTRSGMAELMAKELDIGKKIARDPQNMLLPAYVLRTTNLDSPWFVNVCPHCEFNYRIEDKVRVCPHCDFTLHADERFGLDCWSEVFADKKQCPNCGGEILPPDETESKPKKTENEQSADFLLGKNVYEEFSKGLESVWSGLGVGMTTENFGTVDSKTHPAYKKNCLHCGIGIRLGDRFAKTPCDCGAYFHADVLRHLNCWNDRLTQKIAPYCESAAGSCKKWANLKKT